MKRIISMILILAMLVSGVTSFAGCKKTDGGAISRAAWIVMLAEQFGMDDYTSANAVFSDVPKGNEAYDAVQACADWNVIGGEGINRFNPDDNALVSFAVTTAAKAAGIFENEEELIKLAANDGIVNESSFADVKGYLTKEKADSILEWAKKKFLNAKDVEYENIVIRPEVIDISNATGIVKIAEDLYESSRPEDAVLNAGDIIILPGDAENPQGIAKKIVELEKLSSGVRFSTVTPELGEVCSDCDFSTVVYPLLEDMVLGEGVTEVEDDGTWTNSKTSGGKTSNMVAKPYGSKTVSTGDGSSYSKVYEIKLKNGEPQFSESWERIGKNKEKLTAEAAFDLESGMKASAKPWFEETSVFPNWGLFGNGPYNHAESVSEYRNGKITAQELKDRIKYTNDSQLENAVTSKFTAGYEISCKVKISDFYVRPTVECSKNWLGIPNGIKKFTIDMNCNVEASSSFKGEIKQDLHFGTVNVPVYGGINIEIKFYIYFKGNGKVEIKASLSNHTKVEFSDGHAKKTSEKEASTSCKASIEMELGPKVAAVIRFLGIGIIDTSLSAAGKLKAEMKLAQKDSFNETDEVLEYTRDFTLEYGVNAYIPIIKLSIGNEKGTLADLAKIKYEWTLVDEKQAMQIPIVEKTEIPIWEYHYTIQKVSEAEQGEVTPGINLEFLKLTDYFIRIDPGASKNIGIDQLPDGYSASDIIWESEDVSIATISNGIVLAENPGVTNITAKTSDGKHSVTCTVYVPAPPVSFEPIPGGNGGGGGGGR